MGHECCEILRGHGQWSRGQTVFGTPAEACTGPQRHWTADEDEEPPSGEAAAIKKRTEW